MDARTFDSLSFSLFSLSLLVPIRVPAHIVHEEPFAL